MTPRESKPSTTCENCRARPATTMWVGSGGSLAFIHGAYEHWCHPCVLGAQIDHAREMAAKLPELEAELQAAIAAAER